MELTVQVGDQTVVIPATLEPAPGGVDRVFSGNQSIPGGFTVPAGEVWEFDPNVSTKVTVEHNVVVEGELRMIPARPDVVHELHFANVDESAFVGGGMDVLPTDVGLWITGHGNLNAHGSLKRPWTRATEPQTGGMLDRATSRVAYAAKRLASMVHLADVPAGVVTVEVEDASGWQVGDTLVFTPTAPITTSNYWDRYSTRQITSVNGNVVGLSGGLQNAHPAPVDQHGNAHPCEVLNLTRNVRVTGAPGHRSHMMWTHAHQPVSISNVETAYLGTSGDNGRYAFHIHMMGNAAEGSHLDGCVVHDAGNHAFVPHASHGVTLQWCIAHNVGAQAFWWDQDGPNPPFVNATNRSLWEWCVASRAGGNGAALLQMDDQLTVANRNTIRHFLVVGHKNPGVFLDPSAGPGETEPVGGIGWNQAGVWNASDLTVHNCRVGFTVWQNPDRTHEIHRSTVYNCEVGLRQGAYLADYRWLGMTMFGVREALLSMASGVRYEDWDCQVTGQNAVRWQNRALPGLTVFRRCKFRGPNLVRSMWDVATTDGDRAPTTCDVHDTDWAPGVPHISLSQWSGPGTRIREFENGVVVATHSR